MNMGIKFEVTAKSVNDEHNGRGEAEFILGVLQDRSQSGLNEEIKTDFAMDLDDWPEHGGESEDQMLIGDIKEVGLIFFDPVIGLYCAAPGTKSGFTGEGDFELVVTTFTLK